MWNEIAISIITGSLAVNSMCCCYAAPLFLDSTMNWLYNEIIFHYSWQDRLEHQVEADLREVGELLQSNGLPPTPPAETEAYRSLLLKTPVAMSFTDNVPSQCKAGQPLSIALLPGFPEGLLPGSTPCVHYR